MKTVFTKCQEHPQKRLGVSVPETLAEFETAYAKGLLTGTAYDLACESEVTHRRNAYVRKAKDGKSKEFEAHIKTLESSDYYKDVVVKQANESVFIMAQYKASLITRERVIEIAAHNPALAHDLACHESKVKQAMQSAQAVK